MSRTAPSASSFSIRASRRMPSRSVDSDLIFQGVSPMKTLFTWRRTLLALAATSVIGQCSAFSFGASEDAVVIAPPALDETTQAHSETAVFAGGCFWGVQGVFEHVRGVKKAVSGYAGGDRSSAQYETVSTGRTGHAESVQITFDPAQISYGELLHIFFSVAHDPTELNRQGPDSGTQYRSAIFYSDASQEKVAKAYIDQLNAAKVYKHSIVTQVSPLSAFY